MVEYITTVSIHASPERVWDILTESAGYADWNPEIVGIEGRMAPDARIKARVKLGSGAIRTIALRVTAFQPPTRMEWTGGLPLGLFVGRREFAVIPRDGETDFRMHLRMSGPFAPLILKSVGDRQPEIETFSAALRARAEQAPAPVTSDSPRL
jgi:uncharacterized protein YndB with AHSA1/START domain